MTPTYYTLLSQLLAGTDFCYYKTFPGHEKYIAYTDMGRLEVAIKTTNFVLDTTSLLTAIKNNDVTVLYLTIIPLRA